MKLDVVREWIK